MEVKHWVKEWMKFSNITYVMNSQPSYTKFEQVSQIDPIFKSCFAIFLLTQLHVRKVTQVKTKT